MSTHVRAYDIHGMRLRVEADGEALARTVHSLIAPFAAAEAPADAFILRLAYGRPTPPDAAAMRLFHEGRLPGGLAYRTFAADGQRVVELPDAATLCVDLPAGRAEVTVMPGQEWAAGYACVIPAVCDFLAAAGQHVVHAACLADGETGPALLMAGPSGVGKSTTALALMGQGFDLASDDASFLCRRPQGELAVWGLPRACKVHARTLALLPWLKPLPRKPAVTPEEYFINLEALGRPTCRSLHRPALILLLGPRNDQAHRLWPADRVEAFARLTRENVRAYDTRAAGPAGQAFRLLGELIRSCPIHHLSVGPDLSRLAEHIRPLLPSRPA